MVMLSFVLVAGIPGRTRGQVAGARFLLWRPTATSNSMGGVGTAISQDAFAGYFNPAGLAFSKGFNLAGSFERPIPFLGNTAHSFIGASGNVGPVGAFGLSANLFWKGEYVRTVSNGPTPLGVQKPFDWQVKASYARLLSDGLSVGGSLSVLTQELSDVGTEHEQGQGRSTAVLFDAGFMASDLITEATWDPGGPDEEAPLRDISDPLSHRGVSLGVALLNLGKKTSFIDANQPDNLPWLLSVGFAYSPVRSNVTGLLLAVDLEKQLYEHSTLDYVHWGAELRIIRLVSIRGGYFQDTYGPKNSYGTWGAGVHLRFMSFNVARYTRSLLPSWDFDGTFTWEL